MRNAITRPFCATALEDATVSYSAASIIRAGSPELIGIEGAEGSSWWAFNPRLRARLRARLARGLSLSVPEVTTAEGRKARKVLSKEGSPFKDIN
jgi:hypothetical protein